MTSLADSCVLVTGPTGFVGSHLCPLLLERGAGEVHAISRTPAAHLPEGVVRHAGDLADPGIAQAVIEAAKPDVIFHLAGSVAPSRDVEQVLPSLRDNLIATVNVLTAATEAGTGRIVVIPSLEEPTNGGDDAVPPSPYAASKWAAGGYARMFRLLYGTPVVSARLMMMYGPHQAESKVVPYVIRSLLDGEAPRLGTGRREIDWVYATDVAEGLLAAATTPGIEGQTFDLGSGRLTTLRDVVETLHELIGGDVEPHLGALPDRPAEPERRADVETAERALGWRATTSLRDGLARTVEWYRGAGHEAA